MVQMPTKPHERLPLVRRVAAFVLLFSGSAQAHIDLISPAPRYAPGVSANANKSCPCGVGTTNRVCNKPAERSDPDRSLDVTPLTAGEMVTIQFNETVNHSGRYRIAIDYDGADLDDFNENILLDVPDSATHNVGTGIEWELTFQVPAMECTNCTLQLIQVMDVSTEDEVPDPTTLSTYYQCADITISGGAPEPEPSASASTAPLPSSSASAAPASSTSVPMTSLTATMGPAPMLTIPPPPPSAAATMSSALPDPMTTSSTAATASPPAMSTVVAPASSSAAPMPELSAPVPMASVSTPFDTDGESDGATCSVTTLGKPTSFGAVRAMLAAFGLVSRARRSRGRTHSANQ